MKLDGMIRVIAALEAGAREDCPYCKALASMIEVELDRDIREPVAGEPGRLAGIESNPMCHHYQTTHR